MASNRTYELRIYEDFADKTGKYCRLYIQVNHKEISIHQSDGQNVLNKAMHHSEVKLITGFFANLNELFLSEDK